MAHATSTTARYRPHHTLQLLPSVQMSDPSEQAANASLMLTGRQESVTFPCKKKLHAGVDFEGTFKTSGLSSVASSPPWRSSSTSTAPGPQPARIFILFYRITTGRGGSTTPLSIVLPIPSIKPLHSSSPLLLFGWHWRTLQLLVLAF